MIPTKEIALTELTYDPRNARLHSRENIEAIKISLQEFGLRKPIIISPTRVILAGNGTVRAARELGWKTIMAIEFHGSEEEQKAFAIADNRSAELGTWDEVGLAELLTSLNDDLLAAAGYTPMTVDDLLASIQEAQDVTLPDIDERFQALATRSMILTYPRSEYDKIIALFAATRARYGFDSNSEALAHLLDIMVGEPA
jgi:hypothetical protein